eukprot:11056298-Alexandrium_andersonii.AAC.1
MQHCALDAADSISQRRGRKSQDRLLQCGVRDPVYSPRGTGYGSQDDLARRRAHELSLIHISEPTRLALI